MLVCRRCELLMHTDTHEVAMQQTATEDHFANHIAKCPKPLLRMHSLSPYMLRPCNQAIENTGVGP